MTWLLLVAAAMAVWLAWFAWSRRHTAAAKPTPVAPVASVASAAERAEGYTSMATAGSPLTPYLDKAVDKSLPAETAGESVAFDREEVKMVLQRVVQRINARSPDIELQLIAFDSVKKVVDVYKTLKYEADMQVHSMTKNFSSRVTARVDVSSDGKEYVRALAVHNAKVETAGPRPATDPAVGTHERYADFEPAVFRYVPKV